MGVLNVTPDSFSDGGLWAEPAAAVARALRMQQSGADIVDVGGESTRPGAGEVSLDEELQRVIPVIEGIAQQGGGPVSIDTSKPEVMLAAARAGAGMINDVYAGSSAGLADRDFGDAANNGVGALLTTDSVVYVIDPVINVSLDPQDFTHTLRLPSISALPTADES